MFSSQRPTSDVEQLDCLVNSGGNRDNIGDLLGALLAQNLRYGRFDVGARPPADVDPAGSPVVFSNQVHQAGSTTGGACNSEHSITPFPSSSINAYRAILSAPARLVNAAAGLLHPVC